MKNFLKAIASEDSQEIINLIKNSEDLDSKLLDQLLSECNSLEMQELIKKEFYKKLNTENPAKPSSSSSDKKNEKLDNSIDEAIDEKNESATELSVKPSIDNIKTSELLNSDDLYEELSEEEALKKYKFSNSKYDKALEMFMTSFKTNIPNINFDKAGALSKLIVEQIISEFLNTFPKEVRSKSHNLRENAKLCMNIYYKTLDCSDFVKMSLEEMQSEDLKSKDSEYIKNSILASQVAKSAAETDMFKCSKCKQKKCTYSQLQTRSCDEPMTTFVTCTICGNRWKF